MAIDYTISLEPHRHLVDVAIRIAAPVAPLVVGMPSWTPGSYLLREFPRNVQDFSAHDASGLALRWHKLDKNSWSVGSGPETVGPVTVRYRVYANELSVRTSHVDASHGYINGASVFMFVRGREEERSRLTINAPDGWRTATSLHEEEDGSFVANDYDMLVDCPIEIGTHRTIGWEQQGMPHRYVVWGAEKLEEGRLVADTRRIIDVCAEMFGGLPYDRYLFILHVAPDARGGLEHKSSSSLLVAPSSLAGEDYEKLISLVAHEFFHVWLGKRIRPEPLGLYDYCAENYTRNLWVVEGFTTYYTEMVLLRAGLLTGEKFLARIGGWIAQHEALPGRLHQSLEDSSFDAWIKFYRPDANTPNAQVSYYAKGALAALVLDLEIRRRTVGARSLDDVMRLLWERYGVKDLGFPEDREQGIKAVLQEVAGGPLEFFDELVAGTAEIDFDRYLSAAGLELAALPEGTVRKPGAAGAPPPVHESRWGVRLREDGGRVRITQVLEGTAAAEAGLNSGDEIVGVDGVRASVAEIARIADGASPGDVIEVVVIRRGRLVTLRLAARNERPWRSRIVERVGASTEELAIRKGWLGGGSGD